MRKKRRKITNAPRLYVAENKYGFLVSTKCVLFVQCIREVMADYYFTWNRNCSVSF